MNNNKKNRKSKVADDNGGGDGFTQEERDIIEASLTLASFKHTEFDKETLSELETLKRKFHGVAKDEQISIPPSCKRPRSQGRSRTPRAKSVQVTRAQELVNNKNDPPQVQVNKIPDLNYSTPEQYKCLAGSKDSQKSSPSSTRELVERKNHPPQLEEVEFIIQVSALYFTPEKCKIIGGGKDSQKSSPNYKPPESRSQAQQLVKPKNLPPQLQEDQVIQVTGLHYNPEQSKLLAGAKDTHKSSASINRPESGSQADQELFKIDNHPPQVREVAQVNQLQDLNDHPEEHMSLIDGYVPLEMPAVPSLSNMICSLQMGKAEVGPKHVVPMLAEGEDIVNDVNVTTYDPNGKPYEFDVEALEEEKENYTNSIEMELKGSHLLPFANIFGSFQIQ